MWQRLFSSEFRGYFSMSFLEIQLFFIFPDDFSFKFVIQDSTKLELVIFTERSNPDSFITFLFVCLYKPPSFS